MELSAFFFYRFVLAAVQHAHGFLPGEVEEHAPVVVQPAIAGRQPHAVMQQAIRHFDFQRYAFVTAVGQKDPGQSDI